MKTNHQRHFKGKTHPDKSMQSWGRESTFADIFIGTGIPNDFTNGHRGMARSVRGAKKYVRSRIRFHEKAATKALMKEDQNEV